MPLTITDDELAGLGLSAEEARIELALTLYRQKRIGDGRAARLLGISRLDFWALRGERDVPLNYDVDDLREDLATFDRLEAQGKLPEVGAVRAGEPVGAATP